MLNNLTWLLSYGAPVPDSLSVTAHCLPTVCPLSTISVPTVRVCAATCLVQQQATAAGGAKKGNGNSKPHRNGGGSVSAHPARRREVRRASFARYYRKFIHWLVLMLAVTCEGAHTLRSCAAMYCPFVSHLCALVITLDLVVCVAICRGYGDWSSACLSYLCDDTTSHAAHSLPHCVTATRPGWRHAYGNYCCRRQEKQSS